MTLEVTREFLGWCSLINIGILMWWAMFIWFGHDFVYRMHTKWFKLNPETFDALHYGGITFFKLCIFVFNLGPYLALHIMG